MPYQQPGFLLKWIKYVVSCVPLLHPCTPAHPYPRHASHWPRDATQVLVCICEVCEKIRCAGRNGSHDGRGRGSRSPKRGRAAENSKQNRCYFHLFLERRQVQTDAHAKVSVRIPYTYFWLYALLPFFLLRSPLCTRPSTDVPPTPLSFSVCCTM